MSKLQWYWHRLRAMEPGEVGAHLRRKFFQWSDEQALPNWSGALVQTGGSSNFPQLPAADAAPPELVEALQHDVRDILAGRWKAFGHLNLKVDDPPRWHTDYFLGKDLETDEPAFRLDHRRLPDRADIKLIWELSRWHQLVRLAMAAHVLNDAHAGAKCLEWLEDWVRHNPPYRGWNWTSALEAGMRLVQFTWMDALLQSQAEARDYSHKLAQLRLEILPAHVWFVWRNRSFGSSANNHLIGELAGLILAVARWQELARWASPLAGLQKLWEREVLAQFAEDGGNREQALNYHLFSWEFCWQTWAVLRAAGRGISTEVEERLRRAMDFFVNVQVDAEVWDYGDSDNAFVTPFFLSAERATGEWRDWFHDAESSPAIRYWWPARKSFESPVSSSRPRASASAVKLPGGWQILSESGVVVSRSENWTLRWDVSPMGYLSTAAHGHLDALHLSIWYRGVAVLIDPGTGAYYADRELRTYLASWEAHNGPHPVRSDFPKRAGPFLWAARHAEPNLRPGSDSSLSGELALPSGRVKRTLAPLNRDEGWQVDDAFVPEANSNGREFCVRWQFAPGAKLDRPGQREFQIARNGVSVRVEVSEDWAEVDPVVEKSVRSVASRAASKLDTAFAGTVSPTFRRVEWAPYLKLVARASDKPCVFRTTFLACHDS